MRHLLVTFGVLPALLVLGGHEADAKKIASASVSYLDGKASVLRNAKKHTKEGAIVKKAPWRGKIGRAHV